MTHDNCGSELRPELAGMMESSQMLLDPVWFFGGELGEVRCMHRKSHSLIPGDRTQLGALCLVKIEFLDELHFASRVAVLDTEVDGSFEVLCVLESRDPEPELAHPTI